MRNSSLVERQGIDNNRASSMAPKLRITPYGVLVGEHSKGDEGMPARRAGALGKANVGISNDNAGEKPAHRKTKVS